MEKTSAFHQAEGRTRWDEQWYTPVLGRFALLFVLILLAFPDFVLSLEGKPWHVAVYSGTFIIVTAIVASGAAKVRESARATTPGP